jgi:hypothetical protein
VSERVRLSPAGIAILVVVVAAGLWIGIRGAPKASAASAIDGSSAGLATLRVRTLDGRLLSLREAGEPTVVMISSETCTYCRAAMRDMAATGRPLSHLRIVTLEGAAAGEPMSRTAGLTGMTLAGPESPGAAALFTFQIRGTPTFLFLDAKGEVRATLIGYPGSRGMRPWIGVMTGERAGVDG